MVILLPATPANQKCQLISKCVLLPKAKYSCTSAFWGKVQVNEDPHNNGRGKKIFSLDVSGQSHPIFNVSVWKSHFNIKK